MPIHNKLIKPSACQATHYNGTRNKSIVRSLARRGLKLAPVVALSIIGAASSINTSALGKQIYFSVDASNAVIEVSLPSANTVVDMTPSGSGTFRANTLPVTVGTNSANGYQLTMYADNPSLTSTTQINGKTYAINTLSGSVSSAEFADSAHTASMNKWGFTTNGSVYHPMPSSSSPTLISNYGSNTDGATSYVAFGVKMDNEIPAGTYGTTITFVATANYVATCEPNAICYVGNGGTGGMGVQTATSNTETTLWPSNFQRSGYGFAGWNTKADDTGYTYGPNQTLTASQVGDLSAEGLTLYAIWIPSAGSIQNWTGCATAQHGVATALTDLRDGNTYAVVKQKDDKCWMIENLRLGSLPALSSADTNILDTWTGMVVNYASGTTATSLPVSNDSASYWCKDDTPACINQAKLNAISVVQSVANLTSPDQAAYSYGNYYNFYSATAGSGTYEMADHTDANQSICPAGWRLPTGGNAERPNIAATSDYWALGVAVTGVAPDGNMVYPYSSNLFRAYPVNMVFAGYQGPEASVMQRGTVATVVSSTSRLPARPNYFSVTGAVAAPGTDNNIHKNYGFTVRCLTQ